MTLMQGLKSNIVVFSTSCCDLYFLWVWCKHGNRSLRLEFVAIVEVGMAIDYKVVNCQIEFCFEGHVGWCILWFCVSGLMFEWFMAAGHSVNNDILILGVSKVGIDSRKHNLKVNNAMIYFWGWIGAWGSSHQDILMHFMKRSIWNALLSLEWNLDFEWKENITHTIGRLH